MEFGRADRVFRHDERDRILELPQRPLHHVDVLVLPPTPDHRDYKLVVPDPELSPTWCALFGGNVTSGGPWWCKYAPRSAAQDADAAVQPPPGWCYTPRAPSPTTGTTGVLPGPGAPSGMPRPWTNRRRAVPGTALPAVAVRD